MSIPAGKSFPFIVCFFLQRGKFFNAPRLANFCFFLHDRLGPAQAIVVSSSSALLYLFHDDPRLLPISGEKKEKRTSSKPNPPACQFPKLTPKLLSLPTCVHLNLMFSFSQPWNILHRKHQHRNECHNSRHFEHYAPQSAHEPVTNSYGTD